MSEQAIKNTDSAAEARFKKALELTGGDESKAAGLLSGTFHDAIVVKGKYGINDASVFGTYMIFVNTESHTIMNLSLISYSDQKIYSEIDTSINWKLYFKSCEQISNKTQLIDSSELVRFFADSLVGYNAIEELSAGEAASVSDNIVEILSKFYSGAAVENSISSEVSSSLELIENRIPVNLPGKEKSQTQGVSDVKIDNRPEIEKSAQFVIEAKAIVSPLHGKLVSELVKGDKIILLFTNRDSVSLKIAEALGALDDKRNYLPMKGRFLEKIPVEKIGYHLYCAIAKNAIARIPEEGNVQVEIASDTARVTIDDVEKAQAKTDRNLILYAALLAGLVAVTLAIIYVLI